MTSPHKEKTENLIFWKILIFLSTKQKHAREMQCQKYVHTKCSHCLVESIRVGSDADGVSDSGIMLKTSS